MANRAARILTFSSYDTNADVLINKLDGENWIPSVRFEKLLWSIDILTSLHASNYLQTIFYFRDSVANYTLRGTEGKLAVPAPRTKYLKNIFGYSRAAL